MAGSGAGRRAAGRLCTTAAALGLLTGCGASASPSLSGTVDIPKGYSRYQGPGFSLIYPNGWRQGPYRTGATQSGTEFVSPGPTPVDATYPLIETELSTPRASFPPPEEFANFVANLRDETTTTLPDGRQLADAVRVDTAEVPRAIAAKLVTVLGPGPRHELDLVSLTREGVVAVKVAWYPANEPLQPQTIIDSLRLHG